LFNTQRGILLKGELHTMRVCKFGGSSVANADMIRNVENIILSNPERQYVVVSAPGRDKERPYKITDILHNLYAQRYRNAGEDYQVIPEDFDTLWTRVRDCYAGISQDLGLTGITVGACLTDLASLFDRPYAPSRDLVISRGEYINARLVADYLRFGFVDATELICNAEQPDNQLTMDRIGRLSPNTVIPGFYASRSDQPGLAYVATFARGGSDLTGSLVAAGVNADVYENWTDHPGVAYCNPDILPEAPIINNMTFDEMQSLSKGGFNVLAHYAIEPVRRRNIPINIRSTLEPDAPGTWIGKESSPEGITGIAVSRTNGTAHLTIVGQELSPSFLQRVMQAVPHELYDRSTHIRIDVPANRCVEAVHALSF